MDTDLSLKYVSQVDNFIVDDKSKSISIPQSWMEEYGESFLPSNIQSLIKNNYKIQLNIL